jgi:acetolactate synthase-1/2/3 large subunit
VATDLRLWAKRELLTIARDVLGLQQVLLARAVEAGDAYLPGYTHLQRAQPVLLSHHLLAHAWTLARDIDRLLDARARLDVSPLGAGALAGSSLPLDPPSVAEDLGFAAVFDNSLDVVSDRDFVAESLFALALIGIHLSRMGEEIVLWSSDEFGFVRLDDGYSTGSSMLPQKKNPDIAELARGKSGRLIGNLSGLLATLKGLPIAYNRDLQEDKEPLFDAVDQIHLALRATAGMYATLQFRPDVMAAAAEGAPLARTQASHPEASAAEVEQAAKLICEAANPIVLAGNGAVRARASAAVRAFAEGSGVPVAETFLAKGLVDDLADRHALGAVGLQAGDYELAGFGEADVVIAVGYDLVEHAPSHWNPARDKTIVSVAASPAEIDQHFLPAIELVGDLSRSLHRLAEACGPVSDPGGSRRLRDTVLGRFQRAGADPPHPLQPPRVLYELRQALGPSDVLVSDVGLHKLWIGRMFPAREPHTVLIANGLAGMGFALPAAIATKLVHPARGVVAVTGDGGFLMNVQELETAVRLRTPFVTVVWEDGGYGSITWKQTQRFGRHFGTTFGNPDFVTLAESFGLAAWRCDDADAFADHLRHALTLDVPSLLAVPIDYSIDVAITDELGEDTLAT